VLGRVRCPRCDERIRKRARVCRYCGLQLDTPEVPEPQPTREWQSSAAAASAQPSQPATGAEAALQHDVDTTTLPEPTEAAGAPGDRPAPIRYPAAAERPATPERPETPQRTPEPNQLFTSAQSRERVGQPRAPMSAASSKSQEPLARRPPWRGMPWYRSWWVRGPVLFFVLLTGGLGAMNPENWVDTLSQCGSPSLP
jgi:zinc-ribbon domain